MSNHCTIIYKNKSQLYEFERKEERRHYIEYPSEIQFLKSGVYEVDNVHYHNYYICDVSQLVRIELED